MQVTVVPAHTRKHLAVGANSQDAFERAYRSLMTPSDLICLSKLIAQGRIEVVINSETRGIELVPHPEVEQFVSSVFEALVA